MQQVPCSKSDARSNRISYINSAIRTETVSITRVSYEDEGPSTLVCCTGCAFVYRAMRPSWS
uniref:Uncharacterized protein n=1 Tax=Anguilla anguilla TaxID=7936 RepID=A0A0E9Y1T3_ANGAN